MVTSREKYFCILLLYLSLSLFIRLFLRKHFGHIGGTISYHLNYISILSLCLLLYTFLRSLLSVSLSHCSLHSCPFFPIFLTFFPSTFSLGHFAIQYTQSDLYPVQRLATVARNFVVRTKASQIEFFFVLGGRVLTIGDRV